MDVEVAIVGAGPYGLALAAHLRAAGVDHRIFGRPMELWRQHMPKGMLLKSDGFASNLYDPRGDFPLSRFCSERSIRYSDDRIPVPLQTFIDYGLAFKERFAPDLEEATVNLLYQQERGFKLELENGVSLSARRVVIATGIGPFRYMPPPFNEVASEDISHSYDHHDLSVFRGRRVLVIGGGASAIDMACLLAEQDCDVRLVCRREKLIFASPPSSKQSLWRSIRHPRSGIGPGLRSRFCTDAPLLFHFLPAEFRQKVVLRHLGPAAGWPMMERLIGRVPVLTSCEFLSASIVDNCVQVELRDRSGGTTRLYADHVITATGYRVDLRRLSFIEPQLRAGLKHIYHAPVLSTRFESSVPGLFFTGPIAANSFGPLMRFAFGAGFAARRIVPSLGRPALALSRGARSERSDAWAKT